MVFKLQCCVTTSMFHELNYSKLISLHELSVDNVKCWHLSIDHVFVPPTML